MKLLAKAKEYTSKRTVFVPFHRVFFYKKNSCALLLGTKPVKALRIFSAWVSLVLAVLSMKVVRGYISELLVRLPLRTDGVISE